MIDQASELRKLVLRSMRQRAAATGPPPRLAVVVGGTAGAGVTTLAVNLSVGLAEQGSRVVIVDADPHGRDVAALCGLGEQAAKVDVLVARHDIHEVLLRGPAGIQIVPGLWTEGENPDDNPMAQERLLRQFRQLGPHADIVVLDVGTGCRAFLSRLCGAADAILLVTQPDANAVLRSYACVKSSLQVAGDLAIQVIVNLCADPMQATDVYRRLDRSCRRFLGLGIAMLGHAPEDEQVKRAADNARPFVLDAPSSPAACAVQHLAATLAASPTSFPRAV